MQLILDDIESASRIAGRKMAVIMSSSNIGRDVFAAVLNGERFQTST